MSKDRFCYETDSDHPALIRMCQNCEKDDCPGICDEYKNAARALRGVAPLKKRSREVAQREKRQRYEQKYEAFGKTLTMKEWVRKTGISYSTLYNRIHSRGMTMEQAIEKPRYCGVTPKLYTYRWETMTINQWAEKLMVSPQRLRRRLERGWSVEDTLTRPFGRQNEKGEQLRYGNNYNTPRNN